MKIVIYRQNSNKQLTDILFDSIDAAKSHIDLMLKFWERKIEQFPDCGLDSHYRKWLNCNCKSVNFCDNFADFDICYLNSTNFIVNRDLIKKANNVQSIIKQKSISKTINNSSKIKQFSI